MSFTWPLLLLSLLLVPVLVVVYVQFMRRRQVASTQLGLRLTDGSANGRRLLRRHIAPLIFLVAITLLLVSLARPRVVLALPHLEGTAILAFDVSSSMKADDLKPTRLDAAKHAASAFVKKQPSTVKIGVVAFSDNAFVTLRPTEVHDDVLTAIDRLSPQGGTSLSEGMFASLGAISGKPIQVPENVSEEDLLALDIGHFGSAVIILLSDGEHTSRVDPLQVAELAAGAGVRVFPIGIGKPEGTTLSIDGYRVATALNEPLLKQIATATDGTYVRAEDETQLADGYGNIDLRLTTNGEDTEVTSIFAGAALLLLFAGSLLTTYWFGRVP